MLRLKTPFLVRLTAMGRCFSCTFKEELLLARNKFLLLSVVSGVLLVVAILTTLQGDAYKVYAGPARQATAAATEANAAGGDVARGKYLVTIGACGGCHGNAKLANGSDIPLAGGMEFNLGPLGT